VNDIALATTQAADLAQRHLSRALALLGWQCMQADVDVVARAMRIELKRGDGRLLTLDIRPGHASITREHVVHTQARIGPHWNRTVVDRLSTRFLGRERFSDPRDAALSLAAYVSDNASTGTRLDAGAVVALLSAVFNQGETP
jgi:hypothetical protein